MPTDHSRLNGNTLPIATWMLIELIQDKHLLETVRSEIHRAFTADRETGQFRLNAQELLSMPMLQSVYTETLRLHISFNATREVMQDIWINGYLIRKGSVLQSATQIAHYNESIWGTEGHSAAELWGEHHISYIDTTDDLGRITKSPQFRMKAPQTSFFPFGKVPFHAIIYYRSPLFELSHFC